jgi:hypothetical protein
VLSAVQTKAAVLTGWYVGYVVAAVLIVVVVAMIAIILALVRRISGVADDITESLDVIRVNTASVPAVSALNEGLLSVVTHASEARTALAGS